LATLHYTARALDDLARLANFLVEEDPPAARATAALIMSGLEILEAHPLMGHATSASLRELVISRGSTGYVALYEYEPPNDRVLVVAIRHQREAGFEESIAS
jgi:plasmid stabilization system protein ParE